MSKKFYCDRCGAPMTIEEATYGVPPDISGIYKGDYIVESILYKAHDHKEDPDSQYPFEHQDLCLNCTRALIPMITRFMNDKRSDVSEQS